MNLRRALSFAASIVLIAALAFVIAYPLWAAATKYRPLFDAACAVAVLAFVAYRLGRALRRRAVLAERRRGSVRKDALSDTDPRGGGEGGAS